MAPQWVDRLFRPDEYYGNQGQGQGQGRGHGDPLSPGALALIESDDSLALTDPWSLPTVVAARQLCADTVAQMQMVAVVRGERAEPIPSLLRRPNPGEPYRQTLERIVNQMTRHGGCWLEVIAVSSDTGYPLGVRVVDACRVTYQVSTGGNLTNLAVDGQPRTTGQLRYIPMILDDGPVGKSPLREIEPLLMALAEVYRYSAQFYGGGAIPPYAVVHPTRLTTSQASALLDQWLIARVNRQPAVLSGNIRLEQFTPVSASDAMMLEATKYLDSLIARVMSIPPSLLNTESQSSLTYSTTEGEFRRWLALGLSPQFLSRIEAAFSDMMPRGHEAVFDTSTLTRTDFAGRVDAVTKSVAAGLHTIDEARAVLGLPSDAARKAISPNVEGF